MPNDSGKHPFAQTTLGTLAIGIIVGLVVWYITQRLPKVPSEISVGVPVASQPAPPLPAPSPSSTPRAAAAPTPEPQNRATGLTNAGAKGADTASNVSIPTTGTTSLRSLAADEAGFHFALERCKLSGSELLCELTITNTRGNARFTLYRWRVVDSTGVQTRSDLGFLGEANRRGDELPADVPIQAQLRFESVAEGVTTFRYLELSFFYARLDSGEYEGSGTVVFKPSSS